MFKTARGEYLIDQPVKYAEPLAENTMGDEQDDPSCAFGL